MRHSFYQPLSRWQLKLHELSLTDLATYIKLSIGLYLGYFLPVWCGYPHLAIATACSTMLTLAVGATNFAARSYFYQRAVTNALFMPLGCLLVWLAAPQLWLAVILMPIMAFSLVRIRPLWFRLTSLTVPLTQVLYTGEHLGVMEERVFGVVVGMALGFLIQQLILPPDHGLQANRRLNQGNEMALAGLQKFIDHGLQEHAMQALVTALKNTRTQLDVSRAAFELDLRHSWIMSHLSRNRERLPLFVCYARIFETLVTLCEALQSQSHEYGALGEEWHVYFCQCLAHFCEVHRALSRDVDLRGGAQDWPVPVIDHDSVLTVLARLPRHSVAASIFIGHCAEYGLSLTAAVQLHRTTARVC